MDGGIGALVVSHPAAGSATNSSSLTGSGADRAPSILDNTGGRWEVRAWRPGRGEAAGRGGASRREGRGRGEGRGGADSASRLAELLRLPKTAGPKLSQVWHVLCLMLGSGSHKSAILFDANPFGEVFLFSSSLSKQNLM